MFQWFLNYLGSLIVGAFHSNKNNGLISTYFQLWKEYHYPKCPEKRTTSGNIPKFSKISCREFPIDMISSRNSVLNGSYFVNSKNLGFSRYFDWNFRFRSFRNFWLNENRPISSFPRYSLSSVLCQNRFLTDHSLKAPFSNLGHWARDQHASYQGFLTTMKGSDSSYIPMARYPLKEQKN